MTWNQPFMSDNWLTYSFRSDMAVAARTMRFDMKDGGDYRVYLPQFDYLVYRRNETDYQANLYAYAGYGSVTFQGQSGTTGLGGLEADAESRKYYGLAKVEGMLPTLGPTYYQYQARVGIAPYVAEFNEIASWLILQAEYHPSLTRNYAVTPLARFFYKNVLWETGVSLDGDWMANLMFHF
jgi:hypothetical protein